ncbi:alpha/beta fold hydrolase [Streptomyces sp. AC495_CC817]|uniref:alpha/beta fold hydrolase n=1 Tax=Streptomyces sp. AC495_CC817 TaxID=2823900 RepID=UPI001C2786C5|nr:acyl-CoA thioester hydrolase/BAAT C-terminal domain-containing protein [Streptomyces sp. AC495_CC817]
MTGVDAVAPEDRYDAHPVAPCGTGVLLLAGSSGRIETARADLLAAHGARVRAIRWFGGAGQRPSPHEVPVELFLAQLEALRGECDRLAVFGSSFGAEAALVVAGLERLDATVAVAPSSVVWSGFHDGDRSSHWTLGGSPVPAVPFASDWTPQTDPPEFVSLYESSLDLDPETTAAATIPVERIAGEVLLIAGGDDRVWPSIRFAQEIAKRRRAHGLDTEVVSEPDAGHRLLLPGEASVSGGVRMGRGGSPEADARLGARAWPRIARVLRLATSE